MVAAAMSPLFAEKMIKIIEWQNMRMIQSDLNPKTTTVTKEPSDPRTWQLVPSDHKLP